ncbi:MAG: hypothetical protein EHM39_06280 [Chloroflexi bacterium]|nr:MAG: hypothetical protein EHM39_06280 [Chloroflexota bacterium]
MMWRRIGILVLLGLCTALPSLSILPVQAGAAPCGYVDGFDFPVPDVDIETSDFGIYRARFSGFHTGMDIAFGRHGDPVRAAARGRVTYSDPEGWDTEKGVVVIQHTMPNGTLVNTLYGHMEELNGYTFPAMDQCVERGDIIGAVGWPSRGSPHLHFEVRTRYRHEGGPGYTDVNPLSLGWLDPIDFTFLARIWILPAYRQHFSLTENTSLPPLALPDGTYIIAHSTRLEGVAADGQQLWQFDTLGSVTSMLALPDGRALMATSLGQMMVLNQGSFSALWSAPKPPLTPPILLGSAVVFMVDDFSLMAFTPDGSPLWTTAPLPGRAARWAVNGERLAVATHGGDLWIVAGDGTVPFQTTYPALAIPFGAANGGFWVLDGTSITYLDRSFSSRVLVDTGRDFTPSAELLTDANGTVYVYPGEGRALYAYGADGSLRWLGFMPGSLIHTPRFAIGGEQYIYALTVDGQLLVYNTSDGRLETQLTLFNGGPAGSPSARWLSVGPDDTVRFSSGYLSVVTLSGLDLLNNATVTN